MVVAGVGDGEGGAGDVAAGEYRGARRGIGDHFDLEGLPEQAARAQGGESAGGACHVGSARGICEQAESRVGIRQDDGIVGRPMLPLRGQRRLAQRVVMMP